MHVLASWGAQGMATSPCGESAHVNTHAYDVALNAGGLVADGSVSLSLGI